MLVPHQQLHCWPQPSHACAKLADAMHFFMLAGLAAAQCVQQAQHAAAELATFEWLHEEGLLRSGVKPSQLGRWAAAAAGAGIGAHSQDGAAFVSPWVHWPSELIEDPVRHTCSAGSSPPAMHAWLGGRQSNSAWASVWCR